MRDGRAKLSRLVAAFALLVALGAGLSALADRLRPPLFDASVPAPQSDRPTLVVVDSASCGWCVRFREDVAPAYEHSRFSVAAPLKYVDITKLRSAGYRLRSRVRGTPTFVLVDKSGEEVARIPGYPGGPAQFFPEVERMLTRLRADGAGRS